MVKTINDIQLSSWRTYENYTGPLGLQTLTDITGNHYSVDVEASERNGWGQWHRADAKGVGMDRTVATGTGYIGQYRPEVARMFESLATCPDDLLLFLHHVPYTHKLHSGKTVIQYIYDSHYEGADARRGIRARVEGAARPSSTSSAIARSSRSSNIRPARRSCGATRSTRYFAKLSGIADAKGRVGNYPGRVEAEAMQLEGYTAQDITPWEAASGGKAVTCASGDVRGDDEVRRRGRAGTRSTCSISIMPERGGAISGCWSAKQVIDEWARVGPRSRAAARCRRVDAARDLGRRAASRRRNPDRRHSRRRAIRRPWTTWKFGSATRGIFTVSRRQGIASVDAAGIQAAAEPLHALLRRSMRERFGTHVPASTSAAGGRRRPCGGA